MSDYIKTKEYKFPGGETITAYFDEHGITKITIQALDAIFDNFINSDDRVEVVRCKDCKWYVPVNNSDHGSCGGIGGRTVYPDSFCDEGEEA